MHWLPLIVESRFSVAIDPMKHDTGALLDRATEVICSRGQQPIQSIAGTERSFGPRWQQFLFYHPYFLVSRTTVRIREGRLHYRLHHPLVVLLPFAIILLSGGRGGPISLLFLLSAVVFHSTFIFFVHRDLVCEILGNGDRGQWIVDQAKAGSGTRPSSAVQN